MSVDNSHPDSNKHLTCNLCKKDFIDTGEINYHKTVYHEYSNCKFCDVSFRNIKDRDEHESREHCPLQCYCCNECFINYKHLDDHALKLHDCKICDFCSQKIYPKDQYLEHLSQKHKIDTMLHYCSEKNVYLILDRKDEIRFYCKLCNETLPIVFFYTHYTEEHCIKMFILLNFINTMGIKDYVKSKIDCLGTKITKVKKYDKKQSENDINQSSINCSKHNLDLCEHCGYAYNANSPKEFHKIYCGGKFKCDECDLLFNSFDEKNCHLEAKHSTRCPLGCQNMELNFKKLTDHCSNSHGIVACKYCGIFVSVTDVWLKNHLENSHNFKGDFTSYTVSKIFDITQEEINCALCGDILTNVMYDLEKVVQHYLSYHKIHLKNIENLLVVNPLLRNANKIQEKLNDQVSSMNNNQVRLEISNENSKTPIDSISKFRLCIKEEIISNESEVNEDNENILQLYENHDPLNEASCEMSSDAELDEYNMDGHNDINFSEIQCIFSDTSDDAMTDTEDTIAFKKDFSNEFIPKSKTKILTVRENQSYLFESFLLKCEVCLNNFEKKDKYAKHLERSHGFKCSSEKGANSDQLDRFNYQNFDESSRFISVLNKFQNPIYICLVCKAETNSKTSARKHIRTHDFWTSENCDSLDLGYKCRFCDNLFWTIENRNEHQISRHLSLDDTVQFMKCYICTTLFSSKTCLKRHVQIEHDPRQNFTNISYKCMRCYKLYPNLSEIRQHFEDDHPDSRSLYCSLSKCRAKCSSKKVLKNHIKRLHLEKRSLTCQPLPCEICGKVLKNVRSKQIHVQMKHVHNIRPGFKCRVCDERFETSLKRKEHTEIVHPGILTFKCQFCDKGFRSKSGLNSHRQTHRKIALKCPHCHKTFARKDSYVEHMLIHNGPRHKCDQCEREFVQRSNLVRHKRIHSGIKPYFCKYCYKKFADKSACNSHERVHTREEVSSCPYCNRVFSKKQKLKYHIRIHTGEGLLSCTVCQKQFTSSYSLKKHMEVHERQAILSHLCDCGEKFSNNNELLEHIRIVHENEDKSAISDTLINKSDLNTPYQNKSELNMFTCNS